MNESINKENSTNTDITRKNTDQQITENGDAANKLPPENTQSRKAHTNHHDADAQADQQPADPSTEDTETNHAKHDDTDHHDQSVYNKTDKDASYYDDDENAEADIDFSSYGKEDFKAHFEQIKKNKKGVFDLYPALKDIKVYIDEIYNDEKNEALQKFIEEGGDEGDFAFKADDFFDQFYSYYKKTKKEYKQQIEEINRQKEANRKKSEETLNRLRELVDGEESQASFDEIRALQKQWKNIGQVPPGQAKPLWDNYNALMERYYNQRSIFFELKDLDRKKNLESKLELCKKAENLTEGYGLKEALAELDRIHNEFKNIGPVPNERKEDVWNRLKTATDKIYEWKREKVEELKKQEAENLKVKEELLQRAAAFAEFKTDVIDDWKKKTEEVQQIQEEWKKAGHVSKEKAQTINKTFWSYIKQFFRNKNEFFKQLQEQRKENLKAKEALCEKAEALKDSTDFDNTAKTLIDIQQQWKEIGPVPYKKKDKIYQRFKAACDAFFERKRAHKAEENNTHKEMLDKKYALCEKLENADDKDFDTLDKVEAIEYEWVETGYIPFKEAGQIQKRFIKALKKRLDALNVDAAEREKHIVYIQVQSIKDAPGSDKELDRKRKNIRNRIKELESNIDLWQNNIGFFSGGQNANSSNAAKLKEDYMQKIEEARNEVDALKKQLKLIKQEMSS